MELLYIGIFLYIVPAIIAIIRRHPQTGAIIILNVFLGWSIIGWVVSLVWAVTNNDTKKEIVIENKSVADEIQKLANLKENGVLTEEEFNKKKIQILERE